LLGWYKTLIVAIICIFLSLSGSRAQDTIQYIGSDTLRFEVQDTVFTPKHSPTRAAILSAVMPGMGQIYNKKYWKLPLVYGGLGVCGYFIVHFNNIYNQYLNAYVLYNKNPSNTSVLDGLPLFNKTWDINRQLIFYKDNNRRYRDLNVLIFCGVYVLNIIDATVDAYLFNYDISDDLSLRIQPTMINNFANISSPGLKLSFTFK